MSIYDDYILEAIRNINKKKLRTRDIIEYLMNNYKEEFNSLSKSSIRNIVNKALIGMHKRKQIILKKNLIYGYFIIEKVD